MIVICGVCNVVLIKSFGVDEVLDYKIFEGVKMESLFGRKYDVVIYCVKY